MADARSSRADPGDVYMCVCKCLLDSLEACNCLPLFARQPVCVSLRRARAGRPPTPSFLENFEAHQHSCRTHPQFRVGAHPLRGNMITAVKWKDVLPSSISPRYPLSICQRNRCGRASNATSNAKHRHKARCSQSCPTREKVSTTGSARVQPLRLVKSVP